MHSHTLQAYQALGPCTQRVVLAGRERWHAGAGHGEAVGSSPCIVLQKHVIEMMLALGMVKQVGPCRELMVCLVEKILAWALPACWLSA